MLAATRVLAAPRSRVFAAFSDAHDLAQWWGPDGFTIPDIDFDPRLGARYRIAMRPPEGDVFHLVGEFRVVEPPTRLAFTFVWVPPDVDDVETVVDLSFREVAETTQVELRQGPFKTEDRLALHRDGWSDSFAKLEALLA